MKSKIGMHHISVDKNFQFFHAYIFSTCIASIPSDLKCNNWIIPRFVLVIIMTPVCTLHHYLLQASLEDEKAYIQWPEILLLCDFVGRNDDKNIVVKCKFWYYMACPPTMNYTLYLPVFKSISRKLFFFFFFFFQILYVFFIVKYNLTWVTGAL